MKERRTTVSRVALFRRGAFCLLLSLNCNFAVAEPSTPVVQEQDGILASLEMRSGEAVLRWRFLRQPPFPLSAVRGAFDQRATAVKPEANPYPTANARTAVSLLIDASDLSDATQKESKKVLLEKIVGNSKAHDQFQFAAFAEGFLALNPPRRDADGLAAMIEGLGSPRPAAKLGSAMNLALNALASTRADRRVLFVLTDGHHDDGINASALADSAGARGISVYFILTPTGRNSDLPILATIAQMTHGQVVAPDQQGNFLGNPFLFLDSGGVARFSFADERRYFWESGNAFRASMQYGNRKLELSAPADLESATLFETVHYVVGGHPVLAIGSVICLGLCGVGFGLFKRGRATGRLPDRANLPVLAELQDTESGAIYSVRAAISHLGRATSNEIVIPDTTVSRVHAVMQLEQDGTLSISNKSSVNGLQVNAQDVEQANLSDGDIIGLGQVTLRLNRPFAS